MAFNMSGLIKGRQL